MSIQQQFLQRMAERRPQVSPFAYDRRPKQPPEPVDEELMDRERYRRQSMFDDANSFRTADMSAIPPSGVGETNQLNTAARTFQGFMKSLQDYEKTFANGGSTMWPGPRRDQLSIAHRDLQMQMKELYNLGVLNGPDLDLMNQILVDPTSVGGNIMDTLGIADMEQRIPQNIEQVRNLMRNRTEPALQQLGIDMDSLMPKQELDIDQMSDDQLLQMLRGDGS